MTTQDRWFFRNSDGRCCRFTGASGDRSMCAAKWSDTGEEFEMETEAFSTAFTEEK